MPAAGEVEQYGYCAHNWWLARQGAEGQGAGVARGIREHNEQHVEQGREQSALKEERRALRWMFRILMAAASTTFLALELVYLRGDPLHWLFLLVALVMVSGSAALLAIAGLSEREASEAVRRGHLVPGRVRSSGLHGEDVMEDPEWGISGSPDYILEAQEGPVPVEVKTGTTPGEPFRSHRLQLACYLRLLEAGGQAPRYGLLSYPDGVFRVEWDDGLKADLRATLRKMAQAVEEGRADRDHEHAGRCRGCARRDACDQRLV